MIKRVFENWVKRLETCIQSKGDYVEGMLSFDIWIVGLARNLRQVLPYLSNTLDFAVPSAPTIPLP
jgi:hypothetical protein